MNQKKKINCEKLISCETLEKEIVKSKMCHLDPNNVFCLLLEPAQYGQPPKLGGDWHQILMYGQFYFTLVPKNEVGHKPP